MGWRQRAFDYGAALASCCAAPLASTIARRRSSLPVTRRVLDRFGVSYIPHHYYEPIVLPGDITHPLDAERLLPGLDMNAEEQLAILRSFTYAAELEAIAARPRSALGYTFDQDMFGAGDAEYLYSMVRRYRPKKIIEIGCGHSTRMIRHAIERNAEEAPYACKHIAVEPYENMWLEQLGIEVVRKPVQQVDLDLFRSLEANDILFIDSSHVIKPQGDVVFLYLTVVPLLMPGVFIHAHDICTPRDYFPQWIIDDRRMWDEQYLLEAFLSFNSSFQVTGALNWLWHNHRDDTDRAFPILRKTRDDDPGSFWFRRDH